MFPFFVSYNLGLISVGKTVKLCFVDMNVKKGNKSFLKCAGLFTFDRREVFCNEGMKKLMLTRVRA